MSLQRLVVENVRSLRHVEIDFSGDDGVRQWSILLGENGTGKTTLLRCAALILSGSDALAELLIAPSSWIRNGTDSARIEAEFVTPDREPRRALLEWTRDDSISTVLRKNERNLREIDAAAKHAVRSSFMAGYGSSRRLPAKDSPNLSRSEVYNTSRAQAVATLFSRDAALRPLDAWAMDLDYRRGNAGGLTVVKQTLDALLPDVHFSHIDREQRELMFTTEDGMVPLNHLSDGYQNMAGWVGDLLFRLTETVKGSENPLDAGGILLLDEVDLHLHPVWQRKLLKFLTERLPRFQFFVTTHSPFTAQQSPPGTLHIVDRSRHDQNVRQFGGDPRQLRIEQLLDPLLGLSTAESVRAEQLRAEYRELRDREDQDPAAENRFHEVAREVAELPVAQAVSQEERERIELLSRVEQLLTKQR